MASVLKYGFSTKRNTLLCPVGSTTWKSWLRLLPWPHGMEWAAAIASFRTTSTGQSTPSTMHSSPANQRTHSGSYLSPAATTTSLGAAGFPLTLTPFGLLVCLQQKRSVTLLGL